MSETWLIADTHFGHAGVIKYCHRPFDSVDDMDQHLIRQWNDRVGVRDLVYHLGDVAMCGKPRLREILAALNGRIRLIRGNHDRSIKGAITKRFEKISEIETMKIGDIRAELCHYPLQSWNKSHYGRPHFHGHCHGSLKATTPRRYDVGVDCLPGYAPVNAIDHTRLAMAGAVTIVDHHELDQ